MFFVLLILNDPDKCQPMMEAWTDAGAPGVTVLTSSGYGRIKANLGLIGDLPLMPSLDDFFQQQENVHRTLFTIVRQRPVVDAVIKATQAMLGDLNRPNTGILVVLPVLEAYGLDRVRS